MTLESVKSDLEMTAGELQKQMMELAKIPPSDPGLLKEVLCHVAYTSFFFLTTTVEYVTNVSGGDLWIDLHTCNVL